MEVIPVGISEFGLRDIKLFGELKVITCLTTVSYVCSLLCHSTTKLIIISPLYILDDTDILEFSSSNLFQFTL